MARKNRRNIYEEHKAFLKTNNIKSIKSYEKIQTEYPDYLPLNPCIYYDREDGYFKGWNDYLSWKDENIDIKKIKQIVDDYILENNLDRDSMNRGKLYQIVAHAKNLPPEIKNMDYIFPCDEEEDILF